MDSQADNQAANQCGENMYHHSGYTVVFDLDGTLVHTAPDIVRALNAALRPLRVRTISVGEAEKLIGGGLEATLVAAIGLLGLKLSSGDAETAFTRLKMAYAACPAGSSRVYPDVPELLEELGASGTRIAVCTNKDEPITIAILEQLGLARCFNAIVGHVPGRKRKPSAEPLLEAVRLAGGSSDHLLMVGDSAADVEAARAAHALSIVLKHGYSASPVESLGADLCVTDARELRSVLLRYLAAKLPLAMPQLARHDHEVV